MLTEILRDEVVALAKSLGHRTADQRHFLVVVARRLAAEDEQWRERLEGLEGILPSTESFIDEPEVTVRTEELLSRCTSDRQMERIAMDVFGHLDSDPISPVGAESSVEEPASPEFEEAVQGLPKLDGEPKQSEQSERSLEEILGDIDNLIGLDEVKATVRSLVDLHRMNTFRTERDLPTIPTGLHLAFVGNPGTGKTTVARYVAEMYRSLGLLPRGHLVEAQRSDLVAGYVGQTAIKVEKLVDRAKGGVLFIDEAYSLASRSDLDYGQEALATLVKMMEDNRDDLAVIAAGYEGPMATFMAANPGLRSRFQKVLRFSDLSPNDLSLVFRRMAERHRFAVSDVVLDRVNRYIKAAVKAGSHGNARMVRNLFEEMYVRVAVRADADGVITDDEVASFEVADVPEPPEDGDTPPGMYL